MDGGVLRREGSGWVSQDLPPDFRVPDTVQAVLAARIDLLDPRDKAVLQAASVIGRMFWAGAVDALQEGDVSRGFSWNATSSASSGAPRCPASGRSPSSTP